MGNLRKMDNAGFADDIDATVVKAYFGFDDNYNKDTLLMQWDVKDHSTGDEHTLKFSLGTKAGWRTTDGGRTAKSDKFKNPIDGTLYSKLCLWCLDDLDMESVLSKRFKSVDDGGLGWMEAKGWIGLQFHFDLTRVEYKGFTDKANRDRLWPTKYLGEVSSISNTTETAVDKAKRMAAEKKLIPQLMEIANRVNSFDEFVTEAFSLDELDRYPELQARVADPDVFWKEAKNLG